MRITTFIIAAAAVGALAAANLGLAGAAAAAPTGGGNAQDTVNALQARGYNVRLNGTVTDSLQLCMVTGVSGLSDSNVNSAGDRIDPTKFTTVYVDVSCPDEND